MNRITNAAESMRGQEGSIIIRTGEVEVRSPSVARKYESEERPTEHYAFLDVTDNGQEMDEDTAAKSLAPYFTTKFGGRGFGLAVVLGIVRGRDGAIEMESKPDAGSKFTVLFPLASEKQREPTKPRKVASEWKGSERVLLVDDEQDVCATVERMLAHCGFEVLTARSGPEALDPFGGRARTSDLYC